MPKGGARNRSGPAKDPNSRTSERAGYTLQRLPRQGYTGRAPGLNQFLPAPMARHRVVWAELWRTPQAWAWSRERWRWPVVADLTRRMVQSEDPDAPLSVATTIRQLRDDLGLSTAGLRQHGWAIETDATAAAAAAGKGRSSSSARSQTPKRERRLRAVK